tara:strand:- start:365 stop:1048 length:684 start_codon:yes stop_codon:yes gene_type:complete
MISFLDLFLKKKKSHDVVKLLKTGDLFFDVGAHIGDKSHQFLNKKLEVIMIEPLPKCVEELKLKFKNNKNIRIIQKALGKKKGSKTLMINTKVPTISTMSDHWRKGRFSNQVWDNKILVEVTTLDELIKTYGLPSYIKIDVEGFELDVLLGLTKKAGIISFEFTSEFFDHSINCLNYLQKIGYEKFNFCIGERRKFFSNWQNQNSLVKILRNEINKDELLWGDIYCR